MRVRSHPDLVSLVLAVFVGLVGCACSSYDRPEERRALGEVGLGGRVVQVSLDIRGHHHAAGFRGAGKVPTSVGGGYDYYVLALRIEAEAGGVRSWYGHPPSDIVYVEQTGSAGREEAMAIVDAFELEACVEGDRAALRVRPAPGAPPGWVQLVADDWWILASPLEGSFGRCAEALAAVESIDARIDDARAEGAREACEWLGQRDRLEDALACLLESRLTPVIGLVIDAMPRRPELEAALYRHLEATEETELRRDVVRQLVAVAPSAEPRARLARRALERCASNLEPPCPLWLADVGGELASRMDLSDEALDRAEGWLESEALHAHVRAYLFERDNVEAASESARDRYRRAAIRAPVRSGSCHPWSDPTRCASPPHRAAFALAERCPEPLVAAILGELEEAPVAALYPSVSGDAYPRLFLAASCAPQELEALGEARALPDSTREAWRRELPLSLAPEPPP